MSWNSRFGVTKSWLKITHLLSRPADTSPPLPAEERGGERRRGSDIKSAPFLERLVKRVFHRVQTSGQFNRLVHVTARKIQFPLVILDLHLDKLQTVRRGDDDHAFGFVNLAGLEQLDQNRHRNAG